MQAAEADPNPHVTKAKTVILVLRADRLVGEAALGEVMENGEGLWRGAASDFPPPSAHHATLEQGKTKAENRP
jgi:hypothetical protein